MPWMRGVWNREPLIKPNLGPRQSLLPKTHLKQVLLHDNQYEQACLRNELQHLALQQKWSSKILSVQRKSFVVRQLYQQQRLRLAGLGHMKLIPKVIENTHRDVAKFRARHNGVKDLPPYHHLKVGEIHRAQDALFTGLHKTHDDNVPTDHKAGSNKMSMRDKKRQKAKMKQRAVSENAKYPPEAVDHVSQSNSEEGDIAQCIEAMTLAGSTNKDLNSTCTAEQSDDSTNFLPVLSTISRGSLTSASPSRTESVVSPSSESLNRIKRSPKLELPSINVDSSRKVGR